MNPEVRISTAGLSNDEWKLYISTVEKIQSVISLPSPNDRTPSATTLKESLSLQEDADVSEWVHTFVSLEKKRFDYISKRGVYCSCCQSRSLSAVERESASLDRQLAQLESLKLSLSKMASPSTSSASYKQSQRLKADSSLLADLERTLASRKAEEMVILKEISEQKQREMAYWKNYHALLKEKHASRMQRDNNHLFQQYIDDLKSFYQFIHLKTIKDADKHSKEKHVLALGFHIHIFLDNSRRVSINNTMFYFDLKHPQFFNW
eukprot:CAMPEP_0117423796 /NCGR_PEP_ID=MMETSP0758-20121206/4339_1 /TAXON_ID=63605 /ORGANISM="Percolomonas cosmopolitus, Strain AE-1 (ATCC 50343)" /LENGTH=263 /DNA_ID=CAMNT_0005207181 /DNA_START=224 /DNA_END=1012 /DNA_ORIENTATION=+